MMILFCFDCEFSIFHQYCSWRDGNTGCIISIHVIFLAGSGVLSFQSVHYYCWLGCKKGIELVKSNSSYAQGSFLAHLTQSRVTEWQL